MTVVAIVNTVLTMLTLVLMSVNAGAESWCSDACYYVQCLWWQTV